MFYIGFLFKKNERFAPSLTLREQYERIAQVAHQKWAIWVNHSGRSPKMSESHVFFSILLNAHSLVFLQKTSDLLRKPMSEFPALEKHRHVHLFMLFRDRVQDTFSKIPAVP